MIVIVCLQCKPWIMLGDYMDDILFLQVASKAETSSSILQINALVLRGLQWLAQGPQGDQRWPTIRIHIYLLLLGRAAVREIGTAL